MRKAVYDTAAYYAKYVREPYKKGMNNKHSMITKFNKAAGVPETSPYCSTFGIYCFKANGIKIPAVNGMAYSWKQTKYLTWHRGLMGVDRKLWPRLSLMDAVVCTWSHVEFSAIDRMGMTSYQLGGIFTVAGNTRGGKNRAEGVYDDIYRPYSLILAIYNHVTPYWVKNHPK